MKPQRYSPQWEQSLQTVYKAIAETVKTNAVRLPSIKVLSAVAGVSSVTMWKVINSLCKQGILASIPRGGILVVKVPEISHMHTEVSVQPFKRWEQVLAAMHKDIKVMRYNSQMYLPTQKQLSILYRTSPGLMRLVLAKLVDQGVLIRAAYGYKIFSDTVSDSTAVVMVIAFTDDREDAHHSTPRSTEMWRNMDLQASNRNVRLHLLSFTAAIEAIKMGKGHLYLELMVNKSTLGCIIFTLGLHEDEAKFLIGGLARSKKQITLIDELGQPFIRDASHSPNVKLHLLGGGTVCGRLTGEHLARMGHCNVAWISPTSGVEDFWAQDRLEGLRTGLSSGGRGCRVDNFVLDEYNSFAELDRAMENDPVMQSIFATIQNIPELLKPACKAPDDIFVNRTAYRYLWFRFVRAKMEPLFKEVLNGNDITAWVLSSDNVAVMALDFLHRNRIAVPKKIAIIGFDDSEMAQTRNISSYNFNLPAIVQAVFDFIMNSTDKEKTAGIHEEFKGYISVRASTMHQV